jgi:hypothetical protein
MENDQDLRDRVDQLRERVELLSRVIGEAIPGATLAAATPNGIPTGHELRRVVMDEPGKDRVLGAVEQELITDPWTRQQVVQTTLHYTMSHDGRVVRDHASVYQCGICHLGPLVAPKFCSQCNLPLCAEHTYVKTGGEIHCRYH